MTKISKIAKEKKFDQNEYVIHADGTVSKSFYIIREGEIGVVDANGDVSEMLSPGQKALKGLVVMNTPLQLLFEQLLTGKLPSMWSAVSYPSLKPVDSYVSDLILRINFFSTLRENQEMKIKKSELSFAYYCIKF